MEKLKKAIQGKTRWDGLLSYISLVEENQITNPNASLDGAKSILESISKTILADKNVEFKKDDSVGHLVKQAFSSLPVFSKLSSEDVNKTKSLLGSFENIAKVIGEFRNTHGFFSHGQDLQSEKFDRYLLALAISSSDLLASFLIISHAEDLKDRSRIYYEECDVFNIWFDENNDSIEISGIKISASKALFDQDEIAYKEKYLEYINNPQDLMGSLEYADNIDSYEKVISNFKSLNYTFNTEELERLNNIAKTAMEQIQPSLDIIKNIQIPKIDTSAMEQMNNVIKAIQPNLNMIKNISTITMNGDLIKSIKSMQEISKKINLPI